MVSRHCDQVICLNRSLICQGPPAVALLPETLIAAYGPEFRYHHTLIMVIDADLADLIELLQFPFMQRALLGGVLLGLLGGLLKLRDSAPAFLQSYRWSCLLGLILGYYST